MEIEMSLEAWGDGGDQDEGGFTDDRVGEIGMECFRRGVQTCREMMARFIEQGGDHVTAQSIRANWNPNWGADPGKPTDADYDQDRTGFDPFVCA
jgi:hypothetical protein